MLKQYFSETQQCDGQTLWYTAWIARGGIHELVPNLQFLKWFERSLKRYFPPRSLRNVSRNGTVCLSVALSKWREAACTYGFCLMEYTISHPKFKSINVQESVVRITDRGSDGSPECGFYTKSWSVSEWNEVLHVLHCTSLKITTCAIMQNN